MAVGRSGSAPDMLTPVQHVLENGREIFEHNIILVAELVHKDKSKVNPTAKSPTPASACIQSALITPVRSLQKRNALPEPQAQCDCNSQILSAQSVASSQAAQSVSNINLAASNSVSVATAASSSAVAAAANASISMSSAISAASVASSMASSAMVDSSMASSMAISIASSASAAIAAAAASASSMMSLIQSSASEAALSASAEVSSARETATIAIEEAQQTISSAAASLSLPFDAGRIIAEGQVSALKASSLTATTAAIAIVVAIIGSSLLSILGYFLLTRYKKIKASQAIAVAEENHESPSFQNGRQTSTQSNKNDCPLVTGRVSFRSSQEILSNSKSTIPPASRLTGSKWLFSNFVASRRDLESEKKLNPPPDYDLPPTPTIRDVMTGNLKRVNPFRAMLVSKSDIVRVKEPNLFADELVEMKPKKSDKAAGSEYLSKK
ncbi:hypothetical protein BP6252_13075 [Coleophoma cylindrospora]|uniref:Uncharacterized protein n=1 Tax=Coleophoma cylindrospora TaxID=1849047 RepID=A0A3D8Q9X3_9HELO|nr:hypothetical protein BP6252_13075 [Coleophoma cylindrospora]